MTRLILYNIEYLEGLEGNKLSYLKFWRRIVHPAGILDNLTKALKKYNADIISFLEVGGSSFFEKDYLSVLKKELGMEHLVRRSQYYFHGLYKIFEVVPVLNKQTNAILSKKKVSKPEVLYLKEGMKRGVIKVEVDLPEKINLLLVHLSLGENTRKKQIAELAKIVKSEDGPVILSGDLNTFGGEKEIKKLLKDAALEHKFNIHGGKSLTFPTCHPKKRLDYVLTSNDIIVNNYEVLNLNFSDHLPVLVDFEVKK